MKNKRVIIFIVLILLIISGYFIYRVLNKNDDNVSLITDIDTAVDIDNSDSSIDWDSYETDEITLDDSITITEEGIYYLTGTIDGSVTVNTSGNVKLILNGVSITNTSGPAIYVENSESVTIYLESGTTNYLKDGSSYSDYDDEVDGVIYSKDDLIFDGDGTLVINAKYQDGIVCKDDLKIINGTYVITSTDDGIRGKDSVYILDGDFTIISGGDGIKATNDSDTSKGYVKISNGTFNITSDLDGIQAETKLLISNGDFTIKTGSGSSNSSDKDTWGMWGNNNTSSDTSSSKGFKASDNIVIENGTFNFDTSDDSIHSNNYIGIYNGTFNIASGDDGIHADTMIIIEDGTYNITKSYEGIEASKITINDGDISIVSSDDGINVAGGNDSSSMDRPGANNYSSSSDNVLIINGGNIYIDASGDGIDVNGSGYIYGGNVEVDGPEDDGNAALDYDSEFVVNGGVLIASGSSGMALGISSSSTQYNVLINFSSSYKEKEVEILDSSGNTIISYTPSKTFSSIVISTSKLEGNKTYTVKVDGETYTSFDTTSISTTVGSLSMMGGGNPNNNQGGRGGRR